MYFVGTLAPYETTYAIHQIAEPMANGIADYATAWQRCRRYRQCYPGQTFLVGSDFDAPEDPKRLLAS